MSKATFTQKLLADAFKSLLLEMPLDKISVRDISSRCGISRTAYYYYFKDKFELMWWIVFYDLHEILHVDDSSTNIADAYASFCHHIYQNRKFYYSCLEYQGQNSLYDYLSNFFLDFITEKTMEQIVAGSLPLNFIPLDMYSRMLSNSMVEAIRKWHSDGLRDNYKSCIDSIRNYIDFQHEVYIKSTS